MQKAAPKNNTQNKQQENITNIASGEYIRRFQSSGIDKSKASNKFSIWFLFIDFVILNFSFFLVNYLKNDALIFNELYTKLLILFNLTWLLTALAVKKFSLRKYPNYRLSLVMIGKSAAITIYFISVLVVFMKLHAFSRLQIFGSGIVLFYLEIIIFSLFFYFSPSYRNLIDNLKKDHEKEKGHFSISLVVSDFFLLMLSFYFLNFLKRGTFQVSEEYENAQLLLLAIWTVVSLFTQKFKSYKYRNYYYAITPYLKSFIVMFSTMALVVFAFRLFYFSRIQIFGTLILLFLLEVIFYYIFFITRQTNKSNDVESIEEIKRVFSQEQLEENEAGKAFISQKTGRSVVAKLNNILLPDYTGLFEFIYDNIPIVEIDEGHTRILNTNTLFNIETQESHSLSLFINLHKTNDFRRLNEYFLQVHRLLYNGGYFIGNVQTNETYWNHFFQKFPSILGKILYPFNFLVRRVFPKLPVIKNLYFVFTGGKNRAISKAETLGRLYFCGFKIIATSQIEESEYFIAKRVMSPSLEENPSYGPIIKLERIGYGGQNIRVNKFRTMHPYSEFLQEYIYEHYNLEENGKFSNDFRITEWGKVFRRLWIDELPQLINFWGGDLNLVGVRALSHQYFNLYPEDLRKLRIQFKPGLVPPYYADMPKDFEEIVESERNYLLAKQKKPLRTDVQYFFRAFFNIFFRKARSR